MSEKPMNDGEIKKRLEKMLRPCEEAILMADDEKDLLALASAMLAKSKIIFDNILGETSRKVLFKHLSNN
jgi:hypothetical protein